MTQSQIVTLARLALALTLPACGDNGGAPAPADAPFSGDAPPLASTRALDVLFVIDNSATVGELQPNLTSAFPAFSARLAERFGGTLPDVHLGIISGDVGIGGFTINTGCTDEGDDGRLIAEPRRSNCSAPTGLWIEDIADGAGGRSRNYQGTLAEAFTCVATLGTDGCGFQQHLEAIRRALDGRHAEQAGFLRADAILAVVIVADDDDCTASDPAVFNPAPDAGVGPLSTYRCALYGWLCDGAPLPPVAATYTNCVPRTDSYLVDPADTAEFLAGLKPDARMVVMAGVFPNRTPVSIYVDMSGEAHQENICQLTGSPYPHSTNIRDRAVVDAFAGEWIDGCAADLGPGLIQLADRLADRMGAGN